ncbi:MAG: hypothetical protein LBI61_03150 [Puniceicoccales bacterium]|jgi:hypothetical protein|nr:hypothetical protein [Puniceicoccales bacterium]
MEVDCGIKILGAKYAWIDRQTPSVELDLEFDATAPQRISAFIEEVGPVPFSHGLVQLRGKSMADSKLLAQHLSQKFIPGYPSLRVPRMTNSPKIVKIVNHLFDAGNYLNGQRFEEGKSLPEDLLDKPTDHSEQGEM